ncbi:MAG: butyrate kinase, partial [Parasporobacterium sp.]|nr:butyrate kinase [Parasporobacterium sp.]
METILAINPGSTSTKIAVYQDETPLFVESIAHSLEEVSKYENVFDQYEFRLNVIIETLEKHGVKPEDLTCVVSRCGLLPPINSGAYNINEDMIWQLEFNPDNPHASNVGAPIAYAIGQ